MWDGPRAGVAGARAFFLPEGEAHALDDAPSVLASELSAASSSTSSSSVATPRIFFAAQRNPAITATLRSTLAQVQAQRGSVGIDAHMAHRLVQGLRLRKSAAEIDLMRRSGVVGADSMSSTMQASTRAATFEFEIRLHGAERLAYPCVVAGGVNAVTLHYMHNNCVMDPSSLLLMDAGSSLQPLGPTQ